MTPIRLERIVGLVEKAKPSTRFLTAGLEVVGFETSEDHQVLALLMQEQQVDLSRQLPALGLERHPRPMQQLVDVAVAALQPPAYEVFG